MYSDTAAMMIISSSGWRASLTVLPAVALREVGLKTAELAARQWRHVGAGFWSLEVVSVRNHEVSLESLTEHTESLRTRSASVKALLS